MRLDLTLLSQELVQLKKVIEATAQQVQKEQGVNFTYRVGTMVQASQKESFYVLLVRCLCTAYLVLGLFTLHPDSKLETSPTPSPHNPKPHYSKHETPSFAERCQVELPRAALQAGRLAEQAEFFSFGTNDLTQTTYGLSRDDAGRGVEATRKGG